MKINSVEELAKVRDQCYALVTTRALTAGAASAVPGAAVGVVADISILLELLPRINKAFGLDPEQIDELDEQVKEQIFMFAGTVGSQIIGRIVTKEVVLSVMKAVGVKATVKAAASWVPFIGSAIGGLFGFGMMKYVGNQHVQDCYNIVLKILDSENSKAPSA